MADDRRVPLREVAARWVDQVHARTAMRVAVKDPPPSREQAVRVRDWCEAWEAFDSTRLNEPGARWRDRQGALEAMRLAVVRSARTDGAGDAYEGDTVPRIGVTSDHGGEAA